MLSMLGKFNGRSDPVIGKARSDTDTDTETETERIRWFWHFEILSILSHLAACRIPTQSRINSAVVEKIKFRAPLKGWKTRVSNQDLDARL